MSNPEISAMYCAKCGKQMEAGARFCSSCGMVRESAVLPYGYPRTGQLVRSRSRRVIAGICGGLSEHYGWDLTLIRVLAVASVLVSGFGLLAYIVAWIVIPEGQYALPFSPPVPPPPPPPNTSVSTPL